MVHQYPQTGLEGFGVCDNVLLRDGKEIARFPTPVCALARLDDRLFVILHPYPINERLEYAAENLWALDTSGIVLWKAENLLTKLTQRQQFNYYAGIRLIDLESPKIMAVTGEDRFIPIIDIDTGRHIPFNTLPYEWSTIDQHIFSKSKLFLMALPCDPPSSSKPVSVSEPKP